MKFLSKFEPVAYALLRVLSGFMLSFHGTQKCFGYLSDHPRPAFGSQIWVGGWIELIGGFLIMIGFKTRIAAFLASGMMAVAYFQFHWKFAFGQTFFPAINKGELAALYCLVFFLIACAGPGRFAFDKN